MRACVTIALLLAASAQAHAQEAGEAESEAEESADVAASTESDAAPEPDVAEQAATDSDATVERDEPTVPSSSASGALGLTTILGAVATAASIGFWLEREDNVGVCASYAMEDPPTLGCLNTAAIRDQRDVGIGLSVGFGALTIGAGIAWAIVVATAPAPPAQTGFTCAPGVLSIACAGRF